jgi:hypothetical protein
MMPDPIGCLTCHRRVARTRGCCNSCYVRHYKAVAKGQATWRELEQQDLVLPAQRRGKHSWQRQAGVEEGT